MNRDFFMGWLQDSMRKGVRYIRGGKKLTYVSTNDLDARGKLKPGVDIRNRKRGKNRGESGEDDAPGAFWSDKDWR